MTNNHRAERGSGGLVACPHQFFFQKKKKTHNNASLTLRDHCRGGRLSSKVKISKTNNNNN
ncbi:hypothetical protein BCON_0121g00250 [Botryotinia convoluta]|uniref:Uncharacterized protein n=1 Tax=Botryotinia convoluta TaxID=54673 RepID=A0A4Z1HXV0_9HELO|nr:hypothetical protein BCON_0121g00250 [Botryotinia convoluta]